MYLSATASITYIENEKEKTQTKRTKKTRQAKKCSALILKLESRARRGNLHDRRDRIETEMDGNNEGKLSQSTLNS